MVLLGKRIKEQRKKMNLTQEELGHLINVTKVSICCYENGTRTPTLETLKVLAETFNVDLVMIVMKLLMVIIHMVYICLKKKLLLLKRLEKIIIFIR